MTLIYTFVGLRVIEHPQVLVEKNKRMRHSYSDKMTRRFYLNPPTNRNVTKVIKSWELVHLEKSSLQHGMSHQNKSLLQL
ncbi:hypothetical protein M378DRAFT_162676 [Amanita muscaria Koide BX008]|uniref:Uncharacterized protein n=1 Tax=Amanita muscaria (strain Koide BX008) TaxID=946122 RepID=A0A0C2TDC3_AMAMK|nr:hypothetical protein M378DRAFT_162676 [Amanita muscaria Koide BX008]